MGKRIVIALGGNALQTKNSAPTAEAQLEVVKQTCEYVAELSANGYELAVVHGNGPQVGRIVLASETAKDVVPPMPFDVCGAMSQGYIGYHIQQAMRQSLARRGINTPVVSLVTQVVVDKADPAFKNPTKPIGSFMTKAEAEKIYIDLLRMAPEGLSLEEVFMKLTDGAEAAPEKTRSGRKARRS